MKKIHGRFAPLLAELGDDERFILQCTDFEKLIYILLIFTAHLTRHQAPIDPQYYQRRYGLRARRARIANTISTLTARFPKLKCTDGKLSLLNSVTYESQILHDVPKNKKEKENKKERRFAAPPPKEFLNLTKGIGKKIP